MNWAPETPGEIRGQCRLLVGTMQGILHRPEKHANDNMQNHDASQTDKLMQSNWRAEWHSENDVQGFCCQQICAKLAPPMA